MALVISPPESTAHTENCRTSERSSALDESSPICSGWRFFVQTERRLSAANKSGDDAFSRESSPCVLRWSRRHRVGNTSTPYSQRAAAAASTGGARELFFRPGQSRRFFFGKGPFFRNTLGPAWPAAYRRVCITRGRFFQEDENSIFNASFGLKSADFISKKGVDAKSALPLSQCFVFLVNVPGFCRISKKSPKFFKIRQSRKFYQKNETL